MATNDFLAQRYEEKKRKETQRNASAARAAQDIGDIPDVVDPDRRTAAVASFRVFCETYFPEVFYLAWSEDHLRVIGKVERAVREGNLAAIAMPRGSGKTVMLLAACCWAALIGSVKFIVIVAASAERSKELLELIKMWFETNPRLKEDFPEVCYPIAKLERIVHRQKGQKYQGEPTRIEWLADRIVLPTIKGSQASGVVISCSGMKGSDIRGQNYARPDGSVARPQLVLVDDPQTTESAWSAIQCERREAIVGSDILGMAGPDKRIAGLMACTVIRPGDMADRILDREIHPDWQGERTKLLYAFPKNEKLWDRYAEIRRDSLKNDGDGSEATEFYRKHREAMDEGAVAAWPERHFGNEISAIQHAMNLKIKNEAAFFSEYQNEPIGDIDDSDMMTADDIAAKTNGYQPGEIPVGASFLITYVDVHKRVLYWTTIAWEENFTGYLVDYGTYPDQARPFFTMADLTDTLQQHTPAAGLEGTIYAGLDAFCNKHLSLPYRREDGAEMRVDRLLIDANWGESTDVVYQFCRQSPYSSILLPCHGVFLGASSRPFSEYKRKRGDRVGHHWRMPNVTGKRQVRYTLIDTNYWKTFLHSRLKVAMGDPGCLSLYGRKSERHRLLSEHLVAEYRVQVEARGRTVDEWKPRPSRPDNHWLDCVCGCAVGASIMGASLAVHQPTKTVKRKRVKLSDLLNKK